ncbi:MAG: hypothetical protein K5648_03270 [Erysipelotrichaceae bacterium]|nr:hypothetical protein [Erysipelotrichaceae bacterium]
MRNDLERIAALHERAERLEAQRKMYRYGGASILLFGLLIGTIVKIDVPFQSLAENGFSGSSLLDDSAGGYVLVAVVSFITAVCVTLYCQKKKEKRNKHTYTGERGKYE